MKYNYVATPAPANKRADYNDKILSLIGSGNLQGFTHTDIFNLYSGLGGLHGLSRTEFKSFHEYTEAKKELEFGQFFTPPPLCEQIVSSIKPCEKMRVADLTCGNGNFFNYLPNEKNIWGCEIEQGAYQVAKFLYPDATIVKDDFCYYEPNTFFDLIIGNAPFNLKTSKGISQYVFMKKAAQYLKAGGILSFITPQTFLEDEYTNRRKLEEIAQDFDFILQCKLPASWFDVAIETKVLYFQKKGVEHNHLPYTNTYTPFHPEAIYKGFIEPLHIQNRKDAPRLQLLAIRTAAGEGTQAEADMKKWLYHIRTQKILNEKYLIKALDKLHVLKTQAKPEEMGEAKWREVQVKPEEVAKWMKKKVQSQYEPGPRKVLKMVKRSYDFKLKAYDKSLIPQQTTEPIYTMVSDGTKPRGFIKLMQRKINMYNLMMQPFSEMERDAGLDKFLTDFKLEDLSQGLNLFGPEEVIQLNAKQHYDCGLAFQKPFALLNWEQGGGKSIAGLAWLGYVKPRVKNSFIAAPALAIELTWIPRLTKFGRDFIVLRKWQDIYKIKPGQIVCVSFDIVRNMERHIKLFIKRSSQKIAVLVDESDELTNPASRRTLSMQNCFRRCKRKLLTTGTTTRNNINELYPQLELLFNNSVNLMSWNENVYVADEDGIVRERVNNKAGEPFPALRGHMLFKYSFCPQKTTVFGVKKDTQDVYNTSHLKEIISRAVITRTFDDIVGKRVYQIKSHQVIQNVEERRLYGVIIDEFYSILYNYYTNTGNSRKEANLRLIRQIQLLIKSSSIPHTLADYKSKELPAKFYKVRDLVAKWKDEKVAIGTVFKPAAQAYRTFLEKQFPARTMFYIDGEKSFSSRRKIIADFQRTRNGILVATQQSLKSSVDIETCDKAILEALQWNIPKMSQFYFRFIRYSSKNEKEIHFVTYADTIEQNILALLMSKQKLNEFIKTCELQERADLYEDFDIDMGILDQMITKTYDSDGKLVLNWGKQKFFNV